MDHDYQVPVDKHDSDKKNTQFPWPFRWDQMSNI